MNKSTTNAINHIFKNPVYIDSLESTLCANGEDVKVRIGKSLEHNFVCNVDDVDWEELYEELKTRRGWAKASSYIPVLNKINYKKIKVMSKSEKSVTPAVAKVKKVKKVVAPKTGKRGRLVDLTSERQLRLAKFAELRASGVDVKRGRPSKVKVVEPVVAKKVVAKKKVVKVENVETPVASN